MHTQRDHIKAGVFVAVSLLLAMGVIVVLADLDRLLEGRQSVSVRFALSDGLRGLKPGSTVTLGGVPVGTVRSIEDIGEEAADGRTRVMAKMVRARIPSRYRIGTDAVIELDAPPIGSDSKLNIRSVGQGPAIDPDKPLLGRVASSPLVREMVAELGFEDRQRMELQQTVTDVSALAAELRRELPGLIDRLDQLVLRVEPIAPDAAKAVADIRAVASDLARHSDAWVGRIERITESGERMTGSLDGLVERSVPVVEETLGNLREASGSIRGQTLERFNAMLDEARASIENVRAASEELRTLAAGQRPVVERMLANLQLSADQLKLAAIEVRRSPWRLLYRPRTRELETDNLYDAARSFALAAGTLDSAARALRAVAADPRADATRIQQMVQQTGEVFGKFREAEDQFWRMLRDAPK